jgi:ParB-like chromosome segregation protein Spo0J
LKFQTVEYDFEGEDAAGDYILENQLDKRNVTHFEKVEIIKKIQERRLKREAKEKQKRKPVEATTKEGDQSVPQNSVEQKETIIENEVNRQLAEKAGLEEDIKHFGCYSPIITWQGYIIDGHHRYEICMRYNLPFETEDREFEDEIAVKRWMIKNQFSRRNLPLDIRLDLAFQDVEFEVEQSRKRQACGQGGVLLSPLVDTAIDKETGRKENESWWV